ncbi:MAG: tetratricopeptide repeat protein [Candidatus Aminicenantes bacterium]
MRAKNIFIVSMGMLLIAGACAPRHVPPPTIHIGSLPHAETAELSLDARILVEDAWTLIQQGRGEKAINLISKLGPDHPFYLVGMGYAHYVLEDLQKAEEFLTAAAAQEPDLILEHIGLAQLYGETQREDLAFAQYREVLKQAPDHPWARPRYNEIQQRRTEETLNAAQDARESGDTESAQAAFLKALYYSPANIQAHMSLAEIYLEEEETEKALVHLKAARTESPNDPRILKSYGEALFQTEQFKQSLEVYERVADLRPEDSQAEQRIEQLKNRLGIFELPSQYDNIPARDAVSKEDVAGLIGVNFGAYLEETGKNPPILIDISTSWATEFILQTTALGLLDIYPNHTFQPEKIVTRAQMAEILFRLVRYLKEQGHTFVQQVSPQNIEIADVSSDNFYYHPIIMMISYDFMSLSRGQRFHPDRPVTGNEAIRLINIVLSQMDESHQPG